MFSKWPLGLGILFAVHTKAQTYWFDGSCNGKIDGVEDEFKEMAARASLRLANNQDDNQNAVFERLFMVPRTDQPTYAEVQRVMGGIGSFTAANIQAASDVRIYCDDDNFGPHNRWTLVPDIPNDPHPNSARKLGTDQEWEDLGNHVRRTTETQGCKDLDVNGKKWTLGETYCIHRPQAVVPPSENPNRCTVTLCDRTLNSPYRSTKDLPKVIDLSQIKNLDGFEAFTSFVLLHEMTHTRTWDMIDECDGKACGWSIIQTLTAQEALENSDTFAHFGLLAKLADRGFRLSKINNEAIAGKLVHDTHLPPKAKLRRAFIALDSIRYHPRALVDVLTVN